MSPTRRDLLKLAAVAPAFAMPALTLPGAARAQLSAPAAGNPAQFRFHAGRDPADRCL